MSREQLGQEAERAPLGAWATSKRIAIADTETVWWAGGLLTVAVLALVDASLGRTANLSATFAVAPALAAVGARPRQTALVAGVASAVSLAFTWHDHVSATVAGVRAAVVLAGSVLAVLAARHRTEREQRITAVARVAEIAQQAILVPVAPRVGPYAFASAYISATEEAQLGGDFYEVVETAHGIRLILGDVRGKGVEAVRLAALVLRYFRDAALTRATLQDAAEALDRSLARHLDLEEFVTAVLLQLEDGAVEIVNCGHHPPAVVAPALRWVDDTCSTTPLGLAPVPRATRITVRPGERILLYTDGLVEARQEDGTFVRVEEIVAPLATGEAADALGALMTLLGERVGGRLGDDLAALLIEYRGREDRAEPTAPWSGQAVNDGVGVEGEGLDAIAQP